MLLCFLSKIWSTENWIDVIYYFSISFLAQFIWNPCFSISLSISWVDLVLQITETIAYNLEIWKNHILEHAKNVGSRASFEKPRFKMATILKSLSWKIIFDKLHYFMNCPKLILMMYSKNEKLRAHTVHSVY